VVDRALEWFILYYREHKLDATYAYEGVLERWPRSKSCTTSPPAFAPDGCADQQAGPPATRSAQAGLADYFIEIYGGNSFRTKKPDPEGLRALMNEAGARAEETS